MIFRSYTDIGRTLSDVIGAEIAAPLTVLPASPLIESHIFITRIRI